MQQWLIEFLKSLGETPLSLAIAQSEWLFPALEVVHIFAISLVFGTVAIIDLRLLGLASIKRRYTEMAHELLPWTWGAWVVAAVFGTLLMASRPAAYFANADYRWKFVCMGLAAINMLIFQFVTSRDVAQCRRSGQKGPPPDGFLIHDASPNDLFCTGRSMVRPLWKQSTSLGGPTERAMRRPCSRRLRTSP